MHQNCDISVIHLRRLRYFHLTLRFICCWYQNKKVPTHNLVPLLDIWPQSFPLSSTFDKIHVFHSFSTNVAVYFTERYLLFAVQRNYNSVKYMIALIQYCKHSCSVVYIFSMPSSIIIKFYSCTIVKMSISGYLINSLGDCFL